jgi:hypothetical protein
LLQRQLGHWRQPTPAFSTLRSLDHRGHRLLGYSARFGPLCTP